MKIFLLSILLIQTTLPVFAQKHRAGVDMELQPYTISERFNPLKRNLRFAGYKMHKFRHKTVSWFSFGTLYIDNVMLEVGGVYKKYRNRSVDNFSFALKTDSGIVSRTECRIILKKNDTSGLSRPKDAAFLNIKNVDLEARIRTDNDTAHVWYLAAANGNASNNEEQQGIIRCGDKEIYFVKTTHLLRDEPINRNDMKVLFTSHNIVYLFTYNNENIAAVSYKQKDKMFWCRDDLDSNIKTVVASAASLLCLRNDLYY